MDIGFAIGSIMRLQVPRVRMENGWATWSPLTAPEKIPHLTVMTGSDILPVKTYKNP